MSVPITINQDAITEDLEEAKLTGKLWRPRMDTADPATAICSNSCKANTAILAIRRWVDGRMTEYAGRRELLELIDASEALNPYWDLLQERDCLKAYLESLERKLEDQAAELDGTRAASETWWEELLEAQGELARLTEWSPMEYAPRDGTRILISCPMRSPHPSPLIARWTDAGIPRWILDKGLGFCLEQDLVDASWRHIPEAPR